MIKLFLDARQNVRFLDENGKPILKTCGFYDTDTALKAGYIINGKSQSIDGMNIYAYDYFHPYDYMTGDLNETANTYSIHWFNGGWLDEKLRIENQMARMKYDKLYQQAVINGGIELI